MLVTVFQREKPSVLPTMWTLPNDRPPHPHYVLWRLRLRFRIEILKLEQEPPTTTGDASFLKHQRLTQAEDEELRQITYKFTVVVT